MWRVNPDGEIRDTFKKLRYVFEMEEASFFEKYVNNTKIKTKRTQLYISWKKEFDELQEKINKCDIPFSNLWIAREMIKKIPIYAGVDIKEKTFYDKFLNTLYKTN